MTIRIVEAAEKRDKILLFNFKVVCPQCGMKQHSGFAKLYTFTYGKCEDCSTIEELVPLAANIFAIIEA